MGPDTALSSSTPRANRERGFGGRGRIRADKLQFLKLEGIPIPFTRPWWAHLDLNQKPTVYETVALTWLSYRP